MRRRRLLTAIPAVSLLLAGCVDYLQTGCESDSRYILILTPVEEDVVRTDPIAYRNLSTSEKSLLQKSLESGRFETCPAPGSEEGRQEWFEFQSRVQEHAENDYAYLKYDDGYFQIGLVISAVYYARTEHHPLSPPSPTRDNTENN